MGYGLSLKSNYSSYSGGVITVEEYMGKATMDAAFLRLGMSSLSGVALALSYGVVDYSYSSTKEVQGIIIQTSLISCRLEK